MRVYQKSLELLKLVHQTIQRLPSGYAFLADQMRRASSSVPCNISEGLGRNSLRDQRRFFGIARGSVYEVAALFDVALSFELIDADIYQQAHDKCDHIAAMLSKL